MPAQINTNPVSPQQSTIELYEAYSLAHEQSADTYAMLGAIFAEFNQAKERLHQAYGIPANYLDNLKRLLVITNMMVSDHIELSQQLEQEYTPADLVEA